MITAGTSRFLVSKCLEVPGSGMKLLLDATECRGPSLRLEADKTLTCCQSLRVSCLKSLVLEPSLFGSMPLGPHGTAHILKWGPAAGNCLWVAQC